MTNQPHEATKYWSNIVEQLDPYVPGEQPKHSNLIKLNTNEAPYGPSESILNAMRSAVNEDLRLYPAPESDGLRQAIADYYGVRIQEVFVGNGSDEVLAHVFLGLLKQSKPTLFPDITYGFYPTYCKLYEIEYQQVPLREDFSIAVDDYVGAGSPIIIANPNAPTGLGLSEDELRLLVEKNSDSVVVVDEAYVDFGGQSAVSLVQHYPNLLVVQTLSKSRALAGLRVGFAIAQEHLIEALNRIKNSFNCYPMDRVSLAGAVAAFEDRQWFDEVRTKVINTREQLSQSLSSLGFDVLPSQANFVFTKHSSKNAEFIYNALRERGILVRYFKKPKIENYMRITVGTEAQCNALVKALKEIL